MALENVFPCGGAEGHQDPVQLFSPSTRKGAEGEIPGAASCTTPRANGAEHCTSPFLVRQFKVSPPISITLVAAIGLQTFIWSGGPRVLAPFAWDPVYRPFLYVSRSCVLFTACTL